jgi:putative sugar O-methyltransferase
MQFSDIKRRVAAMIDEAKGVAPSSPFWVGDLWRECLVYLNYVRELSDAELQYIRTHTSLITGAPWFSWGHQPVRLAASDEAREATPPIQLYRALTKDIPEAYWGDEPVPNPPTRFVGLPYRGRLISDDLVRYQRAITNLYNAGLLASAPNGRRRVFLEIGAGYGGLAHQLRRMIEADAKYVIIDLPEMLFFSAVFLRLNSPTRRIYVHDAATLATGELDRIVAAHDIVLLPHYLVERLATFPTIDVAINTLSMQEMPESQIRAYCAFLERHLRGWLYSENFARHVHNTELGVDLFDILAEAFLMLPAGKLPGLLDLAPDPWRAYAYLATPKTRPAAYAPIRRMLIGSNYAVAI